LPGFKDIKPVVFSSIYPIASDDYEDLSVALEKYKLNDAALTYQKDASVALGQGFRCGFLGLLHLEIVQERLEREYHLSIILSVPSVRYRFTLKDESIVYVDNPAHYPDRTSIVKTEEPYIRATMILPDRYLGGVMKLCTDRRGVNSRMNYLGPKRVELIYELPLGEVIYDFYDRFKSLTQGYGSFDYDLLDYRESELVLLDLLVNGDKVDALSQILHPRSCPVPGASGLREIKRGDPPAGVPGGHPGGHRRGDHRPDYHFPLPEGCDRQVLRRRHHPQEKAFGETKRGEETDEDDRFGDHPPERVSGGPEK